MAQTSGAYRSNASNMNWNDAANWQTWDDSAQAWTQASIAPTSSNGTITIQATHVVTSTTALTLDELIIRGTFINKGGKVNINDGAGTDVLISKGGKWVNTGSTASVVNSGNWIMNDSLLNIENSQFINEGVLENDSACFKNNGTLINAPNALLINKGDFLIGGKIRMQNNSTYLHNFDSSLPTAGSIPTATWEEGSICEIIACGNVFHPGALDQTFYHFIWNNSTQPHDFNLIANPQEVSGNFEIKNTNGKRLAYKGSVNGNLHVGDSLKITGGVFVLTNGTAKSDIETTTYYQDDGTFDMSASAAAGTLTVFAAFTHIGGVIQRSGKADSCSILLKGSAAGTLESIGFKSGAKILVQINKTSPTGTCFIPNTKTFILNTGTQLQVINNNLADIDFQIDGTLRVLHPIWSLNEGLTVVNGTWINASSAAGGELSSSASLQFNANSWYVHTVDGGKLPLARWNPASTIEITNVVNATSFQNSGQSFGNIKWNTPQQEQPFVFGEVGFDVQGNYTIETTGKKYLSFPDCDFTIKGNLTMHNNSILQLSSTSGLFTPIKRSITIVGSVTILNTASFVVGNPSTNSALNKGVDLDRTYELNVMKDFIYTSTTPLTSYHHRSFAGLRNDECYHLQLTFTGNCLQHLQIPSRPLALIQASADEYVSNNLYALQVSGAGTTLLPQVYNLCVHQLEINTADTLLFSKEDIQINEYAVRNFQGTNEAPACIVHGTLDLGRNIVTDGNSQGRFELTAHATLKTMHSEGIDSTGNSGCIRSKGKLLFDTGANYVYNGTTAQKTGNALPTVLSGSLAVDNSTLLKTGGLSLTNHTLVTGVLHLTQGKIISSPSSLLSVSNSGLILPLGGSARSFVEGALQKKGVLANEEFIFPTGDAEKWARIAIKPHNNTIAAYTASYHHDNPKTLAIHQLDPELTTISTNEYWLVEKSDEPALADIKLFWESGKESGIHFVATTDLKMAHADTTNKLKWKSETLNLFTAGNADAGTIQATALTGASDAFTFGSATGFNPLPIELLFFTGRNTSTGNILTWATASEKNNNFFIVQRSNSGNQFYQIGRLSGQGNSTSKNTYTFTDTIPFQHVMYYRLQQIDFDGKYTYSPIIQVQNKDTAGELAIYPNPCYTGNVHVLSSLFVDRFAIYNLLGEIVYETTINNFDYIFKPKATGIYFIKAFVADGRTITKKLIVN